MPLLRASEAYAERWEILVYGPPGVGKTTLFADVPNVLYIVTDDNGWTVLQSHRAAADIQLFYTRKWSELAEWVTRLAKSQLIQTVETIVVDTISECQVLERLNQVGGQPLTDGWKFNQNIYSVNNFKIMALVRALKATGKNIVWLSHVTEDLIGEGKNAEKLVRPALSATLLSTLQANVDGQWYYHKPGGNRVLITDGSGEVQTKSRFKLARPITNPTWEQLQVILQSRMRMNRE